MTLPNKKLSSFPAYFWIPELKEYVSGFDKYSNNFNCNHFSNAFITQILCAITTKVSTISSFNFVLNFSHFILTLIKFRNWIAEFIFSRIVKTIFFFNLPLTSLIQFTSMRQSWFESIYKPCVRFSLIFFCSCLRQSMTKEYFPSAEKKWW